MGSGNRRNPASGRKNREAINNPRGRDGDGPKPERSNGRIVRKGRLAAARARNTRGRR